MDQQKFTQQLAAEGFDEVVIRTWPARQHLDEHTHPFEVKALVTQGDITLGVRGQLTTYQVGDIFTLTSGCEHTELYGESGVTYVVGRKHDRAGVPKQT